MLSNRRTQRVVVQYVTEGRQSSYRLIAYENHRTYRPVEFRSIDDLVRTIRLVVPDFTDNHLEIREHAMESYIVFTADWELTDSQLLLLGLK